MGQRTKYYFFCDDLMSVKRFGGKLRYFMLKHNRLDETNYAPFVNNETIVG